MAEKSVDLGALQKAHETATRELVKATRDRDRAAEAHSRAWQTHNETYEALKSATQLVLNGGTSGA